MWKKSGAWFYRDLPTPQSAVGRPCSAMAGCSTAPTIANGTPPFMATQQPQSPSTRSVGSHTGPMPRRQLEQIRQESREKERANRRAEPIPIPAEQQQRLVDLYQ